MRSCPLYYVAYDMNLGKPDEVNRTSRLNRATRVWRLGGLTAPFRRLRLLRYFNLGTCVSENNLTFLTIISPES